MEILNMVESVQEQKPIQIVKSIQYMFISLGYSSNKNEKGTKTIPIPVNPQKTLISIVSTNIYAEYNIANEKALLSIKVENGNTIYYEGYGVREANSGVKYFYPEIYFQLVEFY